MISVLPSLSYHQHHRTTRFEVFEERAASPPSALFASPPQSPELQPQQAARSCCSCSCTCSSSSPTLSARLLAIAKRKQVDRIVSPREQPVAAAAPAALAAPAARRPVKRRVLSQLDPNVVLYGRVACDRVVTAAAAAASPAAKRFRFEQHAVAYKPQEVKRSSRPMVHVAVGEEDRKEQRSRLVASIGLLEDQLEESSSELRALLSLKACAVADSQRNAAHTRITKAAFRRNTLKTRVDWLQAELQKLDDASSS